MESKERVNWLYEVPMLLLSVIAVALAVISMNEWLPQFSKETQGMDNIILVCFIVDYFTRLYRAEQKLFFIKNNWIDLISILPFSTMFRFARATRLLRFVRLLKLLRVMAVFGRFMKKTKRFFVAHNFQYILMLTVFIVIIGAFFIQGAEGISLKDSIWWAFVTVTTVGYGDISPQTPVGRVIAGFLMILGIGFIGALTSNITAFIMDKREVVKKRTTSEAILETLKESLNEFDKLTEEDIHNMYAVLLALKKDTVKSTESYK